MIHLIALTILIIFIYCTAVFLQFDSFADDPGVGWHLQTGDQINHTFWPPKTDPFLFSQHPRPWVADQWLSDLILKTFFDIGGFPLLYALGAAIFVLVFAVILPFMLKKFHIPSLTIVFCCALAAKLSSIHLILRPVLFSFIFFSLAFSNFIYWERTSGSFYKKISTCLYLGALFLLWANMHPSFGLGLLMMGFGVIGHIVDKFFLDRERSTSSLYVRLLFIIICLGATLVTPYGFSLHESIAQLTNSSYFMNLNEEWKALSVKDGAGQLFIQTVCMLFVLVYFFRYQLAKISTFEMITFTFFLYQAFSSARYLPYFAIVATPLMATLLSPIEMLFAHKFEFLANSTTMPQERHVSYAMTGVIAFLLLFCAYCGSTNSLPGYAGTFGPSLEKYPYQAVDELIAKGGSKPLGVFTHPNWGGFITWRSKGALMPNIDDRNTLSGEDRYKQIIPALSDLESAAKIANAEGIRFILIPNKEKLIPSSKVNQIYKDAKSILFEVVG